MYCTEVKRKTSSRSQIISLILVFPSHSGLSTMSVELMNREAHCSIESVDPGIPNHFLCAHNTSVLTPLVGWQVSSTYLLSYSVPQANSFRDVHKADAMIALLLAIHVNELPSHFWPDSGFIFILLSQNQNITYSVFSPLFLKTRP